MNDFETRLPLSAGTLNDPVCEVTATVPNDDTIWRAATDIYIFVDTTWLYRDIHPMLG